MAEGKREYTAIFSIGAKLLGSFRGAMTAAQSRLRGLQATAARVGAGFKRMVASLGVLGAALGGFLAANVLGRIFKTASAEAEEAEQRTRTLNAFLMQSDEIRKKGLANAQKVSEQLFKHNKLLGKQGVLQSDIFDELTVGLVKFGVPAKQTDAVVSSMGDLLVAAKGVNATQEDAAALARATGKAIKTGMVKPLQQFGISFTTDEAKQFKALKNRQKQYDFLRKIFKRFEGENARAANTSSGRIVRFNNAVKDLAEDVGMKLLPAQAAMADAWREMLEDPQIRGMLIDAVGLLGDGITNVADLVRSDLIPALKSMADDPSMQALVNLAKEFGNVLLDSVREMPNVFHEMADSTLTDLEMIASAYARLPFIGEHFAKALQEIQSIRVKHIPAAELVTQPEGPVKAMSDVEEALAPVRKAGLDAFGSMVQPAMHFNEELLKMKPAIEPLSGLALIQQDFAKATEAAQPYLDAQTLSFEDEVRLTRELQDNLKEALNTMNQFGGAALTVPGAPMPAGFQHGGIVRSATSAMLGERGPEAVIPLTAGRRAQGLLEYANRAVGGISKSTTMTFAPVITINGNATETEQRAMDSRLRDLASDFINQFQRAQYQERRLSYEAGYA